MKLNESTLNRILYHNKNRDCAMLTAFRQYDVNGKPRTKELNNRDNELLGKALRFLGYGITSVLGTYAEQQTGLRSMSENSWFVVNLRGDTDFFDKISKFGETHEQDSVLIIPQNGFFNVTDTYLLGTNPQNIDDDCFVKYGDKKFASDIKFNSDNDMLTKIKNKSFYFKFNSNMINEVEPVIFKNFAHRQEIYGRMVTKYPFMIK